MDLIEPISAGDIAEFLGAELIGNADTAVTGLNEIRKVRPGDLTFADFGKYIKWALRCDATTLLLNERRDPPEGKVIIYSDDPFRDYNRLTRRFSPFKAQEKDIADSASIGEGTIIQPGAVIGHDVCIGKNCVIHANVSIGNNCMIGDHVQIFPNTVIGGDAFYFKRRKENADQYEKLHSCGRVIIESYAEIGAACTIDRGVSGDTIIGYGTKIDNQVHVGHGTVIGRNCLIAAQAGIAGKVTLEDEVILWGQVGVSKDLTIGKGAVILAQSGVGKTLEGGKVYFGSPVNDARKKWREMAMVKNLPEIWEKIRSL